MNLLVFETIAPPAPRIVLTSLCLQLNPARTKYGTICTVLVLIKNQIETHDIYVAYMHSVLT